MVLDRQDLVAVTRLRDTIEEWVADHPSDPMLPEWHAENALYRIYGQHLSFEEGIAKARTMLKLIRELNILKGV